MSDEIDADRIARERVRMELEFAAELGRVRTPQSLPFPSYEMYTHREPSDMLGGTHFESVKLDENRQALFLFDTPANSVSSALLKARLSGALNSHFRYNADPGSILQNVNVMLKKDDRFESFVTAITAILDFRNHKLTFASAGSFPLLLLRQTQDARLVGEDCGPPLGVLSEFTYRNHVIELAVNDVVFLHAGEFSDANDKHGTLYGFERLHEAVAQANPFTPLEVGRRITDSFDAFLEGTKRFHDATIVTLGRIESP